jgi:2,4-dienoyl-CoA reductase-like NADH-dependent reductase (Old Yellow Enzyme family)
MGAYLDRTEGHMGVLFDSFKIGDRTVRNRFVRSATYEAAADGDGRVTPEVLRLYEILGRGDLGTIVTGYMHVASGGRGAPKSIGIDRDEFVPGLRALADSIKADGALAIYQLVHAGGQTMKRITGSRPVAPSGDRRDYLMMEKARQLSAAEIARVVTAFASAAGRAREAGADGVQIHAAHGYLLSEFLSPFFNHRSDEYGGSDEGRYRILGEVIAEVRATVGSDLLVLVKMNIDDGTPQPGMTPELAAYYASRMAADGVDCLEISAGSTTWAPFLMCRGEAPIDDFARVAPRPIRFLTKRRLEATLRPSLEEAYNAPSAGTVKEALGSVPLALVGGMRTLPAMEEVVSSGRADLVSLSRPLVREPGLVGRFRAEPDAIPHCISCNRCLAAGFNNLPLRCYVKGLPGKRTRDLS